MAGQKGRCVSCGFLGKRPVRNVSQPYSRIVEVDPAERASPILAFQAVLQPENVRHLAWEFICYREMVDLSTEIGGTGESDTATRAKAAVSAFNKDRACPKWCEYVMGFDPKEHLMEERMHTLEQDRRAFARALNRAPRWLAIAAAILALAQVMTMTPDSLLYKIGMALYPLAVGK